MLVLSGARSLLATTHPTLFLCIHGEDVRQQCYLFLRSLGYQLQPIGQTSIEQCNTIFATLKTKAAPS